MHVWADSSNPLTSWPGMQMTQGSDGYYVAELSVSGTGTYNYVFNNGSGKQTKDITNVPYAPGKEVRFDYETVIENTATGSSGSGDAVGHGSNSDGSYTLTIPGDAFTNTMTTQLNLQITKTDSADASKLLEGAKFTLKEQGTENSMEVTTDKDGIALFAGIRRNTTYDLRETQAPSNYMTAGPWILEVRERRRDALPGHGEPGRNVGKGQRHRHRNGFDRYHRHRLQGVGAYHSGHPLGLQASRHRRSRNNLLYRRRPGADLRRGDPVV